AIDQAQADNAVMFQKVGHDTKVVRTRAEQISQRMDALKAEQAAPTPGVVRVAVTPGAVAPVPESAGLVASRGAVNVTDPAGVRILGEGEAPRAGESVMYHGTGSGV